MTIDSLKQMALHNEITELHLQIKRLQKRKRLLLHKLYTKRLREVEKYGKAKTPLPNLKSPCIKLLITPHAPAQTKDTRWHK